MKTNKIVRLLACLVLCFAAAGLGSSVTTPAISGWYAGIVKPPFNPPNWVFGPAWTILFILMSMALWVVWNAKAKKSQKATGVQYFCAQLVLNVLWSMVFFGLKEPSLGLADIIVLWIMIYFTIRAFFRISKTAGWLMVPYLLWVSFATILNASVVVLN